MNYITCFIRDVYRTASATVITYALAPNSLRLWWCVCNMIYAYWIIFAFGFAWCQVNHITQHRYHITTIRLTIFERGRQSLIFKKCQELIKHCLNDIKMAYAYAFGVWFQATLLNDLHLLGLFLYSYKLVQCHNFWRLALLITSKVDQWLTLLNMRPVIFLTFCNI